MTGTLSTDIVYCDLPDEIFKSRDTSSKPNQKSLTDFSVVNQVRKHNIAIFILEYWDGNLSIVVIVNVFLNAPI